MVGGEARFDNLVGREKQEAVIDNVVSRWEG